jgi:hypothetical protein
VARTLARKSLDKAKHIVVAAARNKLLASTTQNEATESVSSYQLLIVYAQLTCEFVFVIAQRSRQPKCCDANEQSKFSKKKSFYFFQFLIIYCSFDNF